MSEYSFSGPFAGDIQNAAEFYTPRVDPVAVISSALAHGQIGRVAWALVERGDGLVLAIGGENIPIDTPAERYAAQRLGLHLDGAVDRRRQ